MKFQRLVKLLLVFFGIYIGYNLIEIYSVDPRMSDSKVIIVGATSGIGKALAQKFLENKYKVGATGRRIQLLSDLKKEYKESFFIKKMDITNIEDAQTGFYELIDEMHGVDIVVLSSAIGLLNEDLEVEKTLKTIEVNVAGFAALANVAFRYFAEQGKGHLVGISSISGLAGNSVAPAYSASKAFVNNYLESLRYKAFKSKLPIYITNIMPGFVGTAAMLEANAGKKLFWVASPEKAADQIYDAIVQKKETVYVTKRWKLLAWLIQIMPEYLRKRLF